MHITVLIPKLSSIVRGLADCVLSIPAEKPSIIAGCAQLRMKRARPTLHTHIPGLSPTARERAGQQTGLKRPANYQTQT